jgi:tetratricopeptide (TPR) repeat protein
MRLMSGFLILGLLNACGSAKEEPTGPPEDQTLARHEQAGQIAYELERPEEAVVQFEAALKQAQARDDLSAIAELSFNLAVAQLKANRPLDALATTRQARSELIRRGSRPIASLTLAEATALYRIGAKDEAYSLAAGIEREGDADAAAGASFLRGLIADETDNVPGLGDALAKLRGVSLPLRLADRLELQARLALRQGDPSGAGDASLQAAAIRQEALDYRGMARALSLAGEAAAQSGDAEVAADLYLRAGRSAAAQSDSEKARPWLQRAVELTKDPETLSAARRTMEELEQLMP